MVRSPFPMPNLAPLTRLHVHDSLRVNAERWSVAHDYHRQRQNIHYQSLWQPGIIQGLGVKLIAPPESAHHQFKDGAWVEIQPGLAIDGEGNPIVVESKPRADRMYHLAIPTPLAAERTLYIVLQYVDPEGLAISPQMDRMLERFRFDQRIDALEPRDIELCRIRLSRGDVNVKHPQNPFAPQANQLDLRYRPKARLRCHHWLTVGALSPFPQHKIQGIKMLTMAIPGLYAQMEVGFDDTLLSVAKDGHWATHHLICCEGNGFAISEHRQRSHQLNRLKEYVLRGGCLLVETPELNSELLHSLQHLKPDLDLQVVPPEHALRQEPFLFNAWPQPFKQSIELLYDDGLLVIVGELANLWSHPQLSRTELRDVHEWGVNLLHYVWRRQHFQQLLS